MLSRRRMLRSGVVFLAGGAAAAGLTSGTAMDAAAAETELSVTGDEVLLRGESVAAIQLDLSVGWAYTVPSEEAPDTLVLEVTAGEDGTVIASHEQDAPFLEGEGEQSFAVDLLDTDVFASESFVPADAGATVETDVAIGAELRLLDADGFVVAADGRTDTATITVERDSYDPDAHGALAGTGTLTVELDD